jgi:hypothetical protein
MNFPCTHLHPFGKLRAGSSSLILHPFPIGCPSKTLQYTTPINQKQEKPENILKKFVCATTLSFENSFAWSSVAPANEK